jgi:hypothetical protein
MGKANSHRNALWVWKKLHWKVVPQPGMADLIKGDFFSFSIPLLSSVRFET